MLVRERRKYTPPKTNVFWYLMDEDLAQETIDIPVGSPGQKDFDDSETVKAWDDEFSGAWDEETHSSGSSDVWDKVW